MNLHLSALLFLEWLFLPVASEIVDPDEWKYGKISSAKKQRRRGVSKCENEGCCSYKNDAIGTIFGSLILGSSRNPGLFEDGLAPIASYGTGLVLADLDVILAKNYAEEIFEALNKTTSY